MADVPRKVGNAATRVLSIALTASIAFAPVGAVASPARQGSDVPGFLEAALSDAPALAAGASSTRLPVSAIRDAVVHHPTGRLFITGPTGDDRVVVTDTRGRVEKVFDDLDGAGDLAIYQDTVYVVLATAQAVMPIDASSLEAGDPFDLSAHGTPSHVTRAGEHLWVTQSCESDAPESGALLSVHLGTGTVIPQPDAPGCPFFESGPALPGTLFRISNQGIERYEGSTGFLVFIDLVEFDFAGVSELSPDGSRLAVAMPGEVMLFDTATLQQVQSLDAFHALELAFDDVGHLAVGGAFDVDFFDTATGQRYASSEHLDASLDLVFSKKIALVAEGLKAVVLGGYGHALFHDVFAVSKLNRKPLAEKFPVADGSTHLWVEHRRRSQNRANTFLSVNGVKRKLNPSGSSGWIGGVDGGRFVYQKVGRSPRRSTIMMGRTSTGSGRALRAAETKAWEWGPTISGDWVLFGRQASRSQSVVLVNLRTRREVVLAKDRPRHAYLSPNSVNGRYAFWHRCIPARCDVHWYDIQTGRRGTVPNTDKVQWSGTATKSGTFYFMRMNSYACGSSARLMRWRPGGIARSVITLGPSLDVYGVSVDHSEDAGVRVLLDAGNCHIGNYNIYSFVDPDAE